jgi:hypothetical protein
MAKPEEKNENLLIFVFFSTTSAEKHEQKYPKGDFETQTILSCLILSSHTFV